MAREGKTAERKKVYYQARHCVDGSPEYQSRSGFYGALYTSMRKKRLETGPYQGRKASTLLEEMCFGTKPFEQRLLMKKSLVSLGCSEEILDKLLENCSRGLYLVTDGDLWDRRPPYVIDIDASSRKEALHKLREGKANLEQCFGVEIRMKGAQLMSRSE